MNFTYTLIKPPDENWGAIQPDGSWNGMVGMLGAQEIDLGKLILFQYCHWVSILPMALEQKIPFTLFLPAIVYHYSLGTVFVAIVHYFVHEYFM